MNHPRRSEEGAVDAERILRLLVEATVTEIGADFLRALVRNLCTALDVVGAWVTEYLPAQRRLRSLAFWFESDWIEHYEYDIDGTPCARVIDQGRLVHLRDNVVELFPRDADLKRLGAVSYMGVPLFGTDGAILGHLAVMDSKPLPKDSRLQPVFQLFADRAAAEIRRLSAEERLRAREEELSRLLAGAMDAVLIFDERLTVVRSNPAAMRMVGSAEEDLAGIEIGTLLEEEGARELDERMRLLESLPPDRRHCWFSDGLAARRLDGTPFPAEGTLSSFTTRQGTYHALILRDVDERLEAERRLNLLTNEAEYLREAVREAGGPGEILGRSPAIRALQRAIERVAATEATVLIQGETGTGKELVAREIHRLSARHDRQLVRVNCAAIPGTLIESELFGHERGAFTGATARREGRFVLANRGTIFLDEIGELPFDLQAKLLRVLQEGELEPLGGARTVKVDVRVLAATNRDLAAMVRQGSFREDLFYRLDVFPIRVPPLRERDRDVELLAEVVARRLAGRMGRRVEHLAPADLERLAAYDWPGNVRELQNVVERALILSSGPRLDLTQAMPGSRGGAPSRLAAEAPADERVLSAAQMEALERENLRRALEATGWKVSGTGGAAELLGVPPSTLTSRLKVLGLRRPARSD